MSYIRKGTLSIKDVFNVLELKAKKHIFDGEHINMTSQRYELFFNKGVDCVSCKIKGSFFAIEKNHESSGYHLNLYALDSQNEEVLMTKDHIVPKSKGGKNHLSNYQPMCTLCNAEKGHS